MRHYIPTPSNSRLGQHNLSSNRSHNWSRTSRVMGCKHFEQQLARTPLTQFCHGSLRFSGECASRGSNIQYRPALKISHTECLIKTGRFFLNCSPPDLLTNVSPDTRASGLCGYVSWSVLVKCTILNYKTTVVRHLYTLAGNMLSLYTFYVLHFGKLPFMMCLIWQTTLQPLLMQLVISHSRSLDMLHVFSRYR